MRDGQGYGLLAYGSLMHPDELAGHCAGTRSAPVRVRGYRRSFSQEPSWRSGEGTDRGVLTVHPSPAHWFNAILVSGADDTAVRSLDRRERGYTRVPVPASLVEPYATDQVIEPVREIVLYTGRGERWNEGLRPNRAYLQICIDAAERWGSEFADDFLRTTHVGGVPLYTFLQR
jgi:hypothetical protein